MGDKLQLLVGVVVCYRNTTKFMLTKGMVDNPQNYFQSLMWTGVFQKEVQTANLENVCSYRLNFGWFNPKHNLKTKLKTEGGGTCSFEPEACECNRRHTTTRAVPSSPVITLSFLSDLLLWSSGLGDCFLNHIAEAFLFQFLCGSITEPWETASS